MSKRVIVGDTGRKVKDAPDEIDRLILEQLGKYPVPSYRAIGKTIDRSPPVVGYRIAWLLREGYLTQDPENVGKPKTIVLSRKGFMYLNPNRNAY